MKEKFSWRIFLTGFSGGLIFVLIATGLFWLNRLAVASYLFSSYLSAPAPAVRGEAEAPSTLYPEESVVVETVKKAKPAVVSIVITKNVPIVERYFSDPFEDFFGSPFGGFGFNFPMPRERERGTEKREVGGGSGFLVSADGLVITNAHVVEDEEAEYTIFTNDGEKHEAKVVAQDNAFDVAVMRIKDKKEYPFLEFGDSDHLQVGQTVIAIGNALAEFRNTVSVGVVSGLARSIVAGNRLGDQAEVLDEVIQTDAAINPGNSGGPLLDLGGRVVGVNVAVAQGSENIGFALPGNSVKSVVESVKATGEITKPFIGVRYLAITPSLKEKNDLPVDYGVLIQRGEDREELAVIPGSPADKAGLVENDIILEIDGIKLTPEKHLASIIRNKKIGDVVKLKILHRGQEKIVTIKLEKAKQ